MQKEMSGWDTNLYAGTSLYPSLHNDLAPPQFLRDMIAKGHIGMKARRGLWEWTDDSVAKEKARIEKALLTKPIYEAKGLALKLGVSCGVAGCPWSGESIAQIVQWADANMYRVKAARKGRTQTDPVTGWAPD